MLTIPNWYVLPFVIWERKLMVSAITSEKRTVNLNLCRNNIYKFAQLLAIMFKTFYSLFIFLSRLKSSAERNNLLQEIGWNPNLIVLFHSVLTLWIRTQLSWTWIETKLHSGHSLNHFLFPQQCLSTVFWTEL